MIDEYFKSNNIFSTRAVAIYYNYMYAAADQTFFGGKKKSFFLPSSKQNNAIYYIHNIILDSVE